MSIPERLDHLRMYDVPPTARGPWGLFESFWCLGVVAKCLSRALEGVKNVCSKRSQDCMLYSKHSICKGIQVVVLIVSN